MIISQSYSIVTPDLRDWIIKRFLDVLLNEDSNDHYILTTRKLLPSCRYFGRDVDDGDNDDISIQCLKLGFRFLAEQTGISGDSMVATMLRLSIFYSPFVPWYGDFLNQPGPWPEFKYWLGLPEWYTPAQFELLADYLMRICEGMDYAAIEDAFWVLAGLRCSPGTLDRKRIYIDKTIQFMRMDIPHRTRLAAMTAAYMVRTDIVSLGRDDAILRYHFSHALTVAILGDTQIDNPFKDPSFVDRSRIQTYLQLLYALAKEPSWHSQLQRSGHFDNCLVIARTMSSLPIKRMDILLTYSLHLAHLFAVVDAVAEEHLFLESIQTFPSWRLILRAWRHIFSFGFFEDVTEENYKYIASTCYLEALPSLVAYAKKYWESWDNKEEARRLIELVAQICHKLDQEKHRDEQDAVPLERDGDASFGHRGIPDVYEKIRMLLYIL